MLSLEEALAAVLSGVSPATAQVEVPLEKAQGRYLAHTVGARSDHPPFTNSSMDGYALAGATPRDSVLPVQGESRCGGPLPGPLAPGTAMRIFTGAPLPGGASSVIPQEDVLVLDQGRIQLRAALEDRQNVRYAGEDFRQGEVLFQPGHRFRAWDIAVLATAGISPVAVRPRARALVFATGDELVLPGQPLAAGQIYESNRLATLLALEDLGVEATDGGLLADDLSALRQIVARAAEFDFIITSGGASVGDYDLVRQVFAESGDIRFWRARIKPGKPLAFGRLHERAHFFALPGNPVSSLVTFKLFVEPAVIRWHGGRPAQGELRATADSDFHRQPGRTEFLRARLHSTGGALGVHVFAGQGSHRVGPLKDTNALVRLEADAAGFSRGEQLRVIPLTLDFS